VVDNRFCHSMIFGTLAPSLPFDVQNINVTETMYNRVIKDICTSKGMGALGDPIGSLKCCLNISLFNLRLVAPLLPIECIELEQYVDCSQRRNFAKD
jgi:hypothetical protein